MRKILIISLLIGFILQTAVARDRYDKTFDSIYVAQKIYYSLDKRLTQIYKKLKSKLSKKGKKVLIKSEERWIVDRDHRCAYPETNSVNVDCAVYETKKRLHFLEDRLRECEEIGCKIDRL